MTTNRAFKTDVRTRMQRTGEQYTQARRAVLEARETPDPAEPLPRGSIGETEPGTVTGIVSGGGMTNLALAMPSLVEARKRGDALVIAPLHPEDSYRALPSAFDLVAACGLADPEEIKVILAGDDPAALEPLLEGTRDVGLIPGPMASHSLTNEFSKRAGHGATGFLYVQDLQVNPPIDDGGRNAAGRDASGVEQLPTRVAALRSLARDLEMPVVAAHCMPTHYEDGWREFVEACDRAFVIDPDPDDAATPSSESAATVLRFEHGIENGQERVRLDHSFRGWLH